MREEENTSSYGSMYEFREFSQGFVLSLMKASQNLTFCLFYGIIYVEKMREKVNASELKFFQKIFLQVGVCNRSVSLMGVCPPPGSHVGMAHVLMSLSPYIIPPCGRATCLWYVYDDTSSWYVLGCCVGHMAYKKHHGERLP